MDSRRRGPRHSTGNPFEPFHLEEMRSCGRVPWQTLYEPRSFLRQDYSLLFLSCHANNFVVDFVTLLRPPLVVGRKTTPSYCSTNIHVPLPFPPFLFIFFLFCSLHDYHCYTHRTHTNTSVYFFFLWGKCPVSQISLPLYFYQ